MLRRGSGQAGKKEYPGDCLVMMGMFRRGACLILVIVLCIGIAGSLAAAGKDEPDMPGPEAMEELQYDSSFFEKKKDPVFAGILSWYVPGLGQYYSGEVFKGTFFLVAEYGIAIGAIFYFLDFNFSAGSGSGLSINVDAKRTDLGVVETSRRNVFIGLMSLVFTLHLINISDAVSTAKEHNRSLEKRKREIREKYPYLDVGYENRRVYIGISQRY